MCEPNQQSRAEQKATAVYRTDGEHTTDASEAEHSTKATDPRPCLAEDPDETQLKQKMDVSADSGSENSQTINGLWKGQSSSSVPL